MHSIFTSLWIQRFVKIAGCTLTAFLFLFLGTLPESTSAVSSWNPTLLVNTESFQMIDSGDGTTDIELRFGGTTNVLKFLYTLQKFQFTKSLSVVGSLSGSSLTIDGVAGFSGAVTVKGATQLRSTLNVTDTITGQSSITAKGALSGAALRVSGPADVHGALTASGAFRTDSNITINDDADTNDGVLTFGNNSGNQTLKFLNASQRFEFSRSIRVLGTISGSALRVDGNATIGGPLTVSGAIRTKGNLSGATLTVDGAINLHGVTYNAPGTQGGANTFLKNDGAGNLTWTTTSVGNGSGGILSMHPAYPSAIYFGSGSSVVGQLTMSGGTSALDNSYLWTSSRGTLQNYWISARIRLPDNFSTWDAVKPIELRYKTGTADTADNAIKVLIKDTGGTYRQLTGGEALANTSWTTALISGPESVGTWTPKGYITVYVKVAAKSTAGANAAVGYLNMNFETTIP